MSDTAILVDSLGKRYRIGGKQESYRTLRDTLAGVATTPFRAIRSSFRRSNGDRTRADLIIWALKDISFEVKRGEVVGIIGRNGAGKSTLLKVLSRITEPTEGQAEIHGRVGSLLEVGTGFHQELTGRENIYLNGAILGMARAEIDRKFDEMVAFAEVERFIDTPVKHYSSGMYLRLAFAVAAHLEPEILLIDEVLAVGDAAFQAKCLGKMGEVAQEGRTILFVSHNMGAIRALCTKGIVINDGTITQSGSVIKAIETYNGMINGLRAANKNGAEDGEPSNSKSGFGPVVLPGRGFTTVSQSKEFDVATTLNLADDAQGFSLWCILEDMHGRQLFHLREESTLLGLGEIKKGTYNISVKIPPLWLLPGLYALHFKVKLWGNYASSRMVSDIFPLDVEGGTPRNDAILHPAVTWSVGQAGGK